MNRPHDFPPIDGDLHAGLDRELDLAAERPYEPPAGPDRSAVRWVAAIVGSSLALAGVISMARAAGEDAEDEVLAEVGTFVDDVETPAKGAMSVEPDVAAEPSAPVSPAPRIRRTVDDRRVAARALVPPPPPVRSRAEPSVVEPRPTSRSEPPEPAGRSVGARASGVALPQPAFDEEGLEVDEPEPEPETVPALPSVEETGPRPIDEPEVVEDAVIDEADQDQAPDPAVDPEGTVVDGPEPAPRAEPPVLGGEPPLPGTQSRSEPTEPARVLSPIGE